MLSKVMHGHDAGAILATIPSPPPAESGAFRMNDKVVVARDIQGTGIKAGDKGKVIYVQNGKRDIGRSTDLAGHAFQVRFKGGAEIWMTADEIAPAPMD